MLDSCVVSQYIAPDADVRTPGLVRRVDEIVGTNGLVLSVVAVYELDRGIRKLERRSQGQAKRRQLMMFLSAATILGLDEHGWRGWAVAADLHADASSRAQAIVLSEGDLLIFATALAHDMVLVTTDAKLVGRCRELGRGNDVELLDLR